MTTAQIEALIAEAAEKIEAWDAEHDDADGVGEAGFEEWDERATYEGQIEGYRKVLAILAAESSASEPEHGLPTVKLPSISFPGEAAEIFRGKIEEMLGYGVTVTTDQGERIDGVLVGPDYEVDDWAQIRIHPVREGDYYPDLKDITSPTQSVLAYNVEVH
jgi:hypothetical protein